MPRRSTLNRIDQSRSLQRPDIGYGDIGKFRGNEGDLAFRKVSNVSKLYIMANGRWHGVNVGESFDNIEKSIKKLESKVDKIKPYNQQFIDAGQKLIVGGGGASGSAAIFNGHAGFARQEATFSATLVIGSGGSHDTDIDFRLNNKFRLEMTADIVTMNLVFPNVSGNFLLLTTTNGDHDVTNWKVWEHDSKLGATNAAATTDVMWAGGSVPAFTSSGIDLCSFYWDATEQQCYGVCSLAFATP